MLWICTDWVRQIRNHFYLVDKDINGGVSRVGAEDDWQTTIFTVRAVITYYVVVVLVAVVAAAAAVVVASRSMQDATILPPLMFHQFIYRTIQ